MNRNNCRSQLRHRSAREMLIEQLCKPSYWQLQPEFPLNCPHCEMSFVHQIHFNAHMRIHQPNSKVRCEECNGIFENVLGLQEHIAEEHSADRAFPVSFSIAQRISYGPPVKPATAGEQLIMPPCNMRPVYDTPLPEGYACKTVFDRTRDTCSSYSSSGSGSCSDGLEPLKKFRRKSGRPLSTLEKLLIHGTPVSSSLSSSSPPIVIDQPKEELIDVMSMSPSPEDSLMKDISCKHCGKKFLYKCNLARHLSAIHNERTLKLSGVSAGKSPRSPFKVGPMEAIPTEKKELVLLQCDYCDRKFSQKSSLVLHRRSH